MKLARIALLCVLMAPLALGAGFTVPNKANAFNAAQAELDKGDFDILQAAFHGNGVVSGCAVAVQSPIAMGIAVASGSVRSENTVSSVSGASISLSPAGSSLPRFDLVSVSGNTAVVTTGTPAASPVYPAIPLTGGIPNVVLASVYVPGRSTIVNAPQITDKRVFVPTYPAAGSAASATTITTTSPLGGGGDLSTNRTFSLGIVPSSLGGLGANASAQTGLLLFTAGGASFGPLSGDVSTSGFAATLASTAVSPGSYNCANLTVDAKGRLTSAATGSCSGGGGTLAPSAGGTGTATTFTPGSVIFAGASGIYSQNNANLSWDNSAALFQIGGTAPQANIVATSSTANTAFNIFNDVGNLFQMGLGSSAAPGSPNLGFFYSDAPGGIQIDAHNVTGILQLMTHDVERGRFTAAGLLGLGTTTPSATLDVTQLSNNTTALGSTRATDSSPTGSFELFKSHAGSTLWNVDITGSLSAGAVPVAQLSGILPVAKGGTNSSVQNWVDLTATQSVAGAKNWSDTATFSANPGAGNPSVITAYGVQASHGSGFKSYSGTGQSGTLASLTTDSSNGYIGTSTTNPLHIQTNGTDAVIVDTSQNSAGKFWDKGGAVYNVKAYGAVGDGTTDDTTAIGSAITAACTLTPCGTVLLPPGYIYKDTGNHDLSGKNGLRIVGYGATIRLAHATNDLFYWTSTTLDQNFAGFIVTSDTVTRTAGWVFHVNIAYTGSNYLANTRFVDLDIRKQVNGLWIAKFSTDFIIGCFLSDFTSAVGIGIYAGQTRTSGSNNQGSGLSITNTAIYGGNDFHSTGSSPLIGYGLIIEDCDAVSGGFATGGNQVNGMKIIANASGHSPSNHFFNGASFDATKTGSGVYLTGGGTIFQVMFNGCWFASAGQMTGGSAGLNNFKLDATTSAGIVMNGAYFSNSTGASMRLQNGGAFSLSGSILSGNSGQDAISIDIPINTVGILISGNVIGGGGSGGVSVRTSATSNGIGIYGNLLYDHPVYGVAPVTTPNPVLAFPAYANNAAAISGGLQAGDWYTVSSSNPRQVAVVY